VTANGCSADSDIYDFTITGIEDLSAEYQVYPNPTSDYLYIKGVLQNSTLSVYNTKGQLIAIDEPSNMEYVGESQVVLDMRSFKKGIYLVNVRTQNRVIQLKVFKK
jgi:hypothetical protein